MTVKLTPKALGQLSELPKPIQTRVWGVVIRLEDWPAVSGAKPLRGNLSGNYRIRTGDYRVIFAVKGDTIVIWKIGYRGGIYE
jgi:mRNA interferase RelE/StbE